MTGGTPNSPLTGSPLHRCMQDLETAQTHLGDDVRNDYDAAGRLIDADSGIASALSAVKAELNRRHREAMKGKKTPALPEPAKIELKMPGFKAAPIHFPKTRRGVQEMLTFIEEAMVDGGCGIVALNPELLTKVAAAGFAAQVEALRKAASEILDGEAAE
jgi:hypothetical protein